jgi:hypothetical protein
MLGKILRAVALAGVLTFVAAPAHACPAGQDAAGVPDVSNTVEAAGSIHTATIGQASAAVVAGCDNCHSGNAAAAGSCSASGCCSICVFAIASRGTTLIVAEVPRNEALALVERLHSTNPPPDLRPPRICA